MSYCIYYQARVNRNKTWFLVSTLRSFENLCFDRTLDKSESIFEFFVSPGMEGDFLRIMEFLKAEFIVFDLQKLPNRFEV